MAKKEDNVEPSLEVKYSEITPDKHPPIFAYALKVEICKATVLSDHVFVFQRSPENNEGEATDNFIQIASPLELEEVPEDAPDLQNGMPYYRSKSVLLWFRNMEDLELAKRKIDDDLQTLVLTYKTINGKPDKEEIKNYGR